MNFRLLAVLPLVALMAAPVHAGALGTTITEPVVNVPPPPPPVGGLGAGAVVAGVVGLVVLGALLRDTDDPAPVTPGT